MDEQQGAVEEFPEEPITAVIEYETIAQCAAAWRAELARQGLVEAKGGASAAPWRLGRR